MKLCLIGYGRFGKKIAASFPSKDHSLIVVDKNFTEGTIPDSYPNVQFVLPEENWGYFHSQYNPAGYYAAIPTALQTELLYSLPHDIPVLLEKPAVGNSDEFLKVEYVRPLNTVAVGHTFLQCGGFKFLCGQANYGNAPVCIKSVRTNTCGPIRRDMNCLRDFAVHDLALFVELIKCHHGEFDLYHASCNKLFKNDFNARFNISYKDFHMDCEVSWIAATKQRNWWVNFNNEALHWDAELDRIRSDFNGIVYERHLNDPSPLTKQWQSLIQWTTTNGPAPKTLQNLKDAYHIARLMDCM